MDEIIELIETIRKELVVDNKTYSYISEKYGLTIRAIADLKFIADEKETEQEVKKIIDGLKNNISGREISSNSKLGDSLIIYIKRKIFEAKLVENKKPKDKVNSILEGYIKGETLLCIAQESDTPIFQVQDIIERFNKNMKRYKRLCANSSIEVLPDKLRRNYKFSDTIIDYIINQQIEDEEKNNLGDVKDEL